MFFRFRKFAIKWSILKVSLLLVAISLTSYQCIAKANENLPLFGSDPLSWVPASSETVILTRGPFRLSNSGELPEGGSLSRIIQSRCLGPISWGEDWFHKAVGGKTLLLSLDIRLNFAKKTKVPTEILKHSTPYDAIHLLVFSKNQSSIWNDFMENLHSHASEWSSLGEEKRLRITYDSRVHVMPDFFVFSPRAGVLIYSTEKALLEDFANRMTPAEIEKLLNGQNQAFGKEKWTGIRRYRQQNSDAASPLAINSCWSDSTARGFVMKLRKTNAVEWTYFSQQPERAAQFKLVDKFIASSERKEDSSVYLLSPAKNNSAGLWIVLMELLGPSFAP